MGRYGNAIQVNLANNTEEGTKKKKRKGKSKYALLADGHGCRLLVMVLDGKWHDRSK